MPLLMSATPACLVLGEPDYEAPTRGRPQLIEVTPTHQALLARDDADGTRAIVDVVANLRSEDAGEPVEAVLLIDYGQFDVDGVTPWRGTGGVTIAPAASADVLRRISLRWIEAIDANTNECHRVTMVASHTFFGTSPFEYCPTEEDDLATLTWFVRLCGSSVPLADCSLDPCAEAAPEVCPAPGEVQAKYDAEFGEGG